MHMGNIIVTIIVTGPLTSPSGGVAGFGWETVGGVQDCGGHGRGWPRIRAVS